MLLVNNYSLIFGEWWFQIELFVRIFEVGFEIAGKPTQASQLYFSEQTRAGILKGNSNSSFNMEYESVYHIAWLLTYDST